jgi:opacity protein-like surface antigen
MKKSLHKLLIGAGTMVLLAGSPAMAIDLYGFASYWDKKDLDGEWGAGVGLSLPLFTEHLKLDGRVHLLEDSKLESDDSLTLIPFDLGLQVHLLPNSALNPYALAGVSYIYADADRVDVDSEFGGYFGGGLEWALPSSMIKLFGEVVYRFSELDSDNLDDIDISGVTGNVGLKLHF